MRLTITKSKNSEHLYITKGYRDKNGRSTSFTVKKLGTMSELLPKFENDRDKVLSWAKEQARLLTEQEQNGKMAVTVDFTEELRNAKDDRKLLEIGYLFLQAIFHKLKLDKIANSIASETKIDYNLSDILAKLVYARLLSPSSKLSSMEYSKTLLESADFELHQIYRALSLLAENSTAIQSQLYQNSLELVERNKGILYYDCTNFFFELEEEKGIRKYGKSKEHRPNPIVQMGLFMDADGLPLALTVFPGNENEQPSLLPLEKQILKDFKLSKFVVCTDAGLASTANRRFNNVQGRSFITAQSLKTLKSHIKEWALENTGWRLINSDVEYDISQLDPQRDFDKIFYKERWINENGIEQRLIVSFSLKYKEYQRSIRALQVDRAEKILKNGKSVQTRNPNSPLRFIDQTMVTDEGEVAEKQIQSLNNDKIEREAAYDGFYAVCTTLEDPTDKILAVNKKRWQIEAAFRVLKTECKARPVYLQRDDRIKAHFLTCFIALLILRILEKQLDSDATTEELLHTLRGMKVYKLRDLGYLSAYTRTDLTDKLNKTFDMKTDAEFISVKTIKKYIRSTKKL